MVLPNTNVYDYAGKADLNTGYWNPERKLGVMRHFLEIIKQKLFLKAELYLARKNATLDNFNQKWLFNPLALKF